MDVSDFVVNRYGPCLDSNYVVPVGADRCEVIFEFYFDHTAVDDEFIRASIEQTETTQQEDIENLRVSTARLAIIVLRSWTLRTTRGAWRAPLSLLVSRQVSPRHRVAVKQAVCHA